MVFTESVPVDGIAVFPGAIPFVAIPAIIRKFAMQSAHIFIAPGFGEDACGGDRRKNAIPLDNATVRRTPVADETVAVDEEKFWP